MSLFQSFPLTSNLMDMVNQFQCEADLVRTPEGVKLRPDAANHINTSSEKFKAGGLHKMFEYTAKELELAMSELIFNHFGLELLAFNVKKAETSKGKIVYRLELMTNPNDVITLNISRLGATTGNDFIHFLQESPTMCWLADSRSPFHIRGFSEMLDDIAAVDSFLRILRKRPSQVSEMIRELGEAFVQVLH